MLRFFLSFFLFVFGTIIGSFLNCLIYRLEKKESFLKGRSYCPHCKHVLTFKDLIPILSFILLKGRCRYCKEKISIQYPLVEFFSGILTLIALSPLISNFSISNLPSAIFHLLIFFLLLLIFVFDLKYYSIPDQILIFAIFISLLYRIFNFSICHLPSAIYHLSIYHLPSAICHINLPSAISNLIFSLLPSLFFLLLILISKEKWMGFGDFEISIFMGLFLGWPKILIALFFSVFLGAFFGLILISLKKKTLKSQIPFAPFLVLGTFFAFFFGQNLIDFYFSLF